METTKQYEITFYLDARDVSGADYADMGETAEFRSFKIKDLIKGIVIPSKMEVDGIEFVHAGEYPKRILRGMPPGADDRLSGELRHEFMGAIKMCVTMNKQPILIHIDQDIHLYVPVTDDANPFFESPPHDTESSQEEEEEEPEQ